MKDNNSNLRQLALSFFAIGRFMRQAHLKKEGCTDCPPSDPFTFLKILTLIYLKEHPNLKIKQIAEYLAITPPSATSLVDSMEKSGLLKRLAGKEDRRTTELIITKKGEETIGHGLVEVEKQTGRLVSALSEGETTELLKLLQKITNFNNKNYTF